MSYFLKDGDLLWPTKEGAYDVRKNLPVGTYTVCAHPARGFYLKPISDFKITGKIYGKTTSQADRILNTFDRRPHTTGVLLNGEKGSGKTMLAKLVSEKAMQQGISTLVINTPFTGDSFNTFIQEIDEPCVIVFDEFEKVFDTEQQEATLTLLDGVYPTKKLFMLTVNDKYRVNAHMRNRPGRIFYMLDFKGLDADFIEEYCNENLNDKSYIPQMCRLTMLFESFNFDMLKALVEEMNRYNESPNQALEMLNAKPFEAGSTKHMITVTYNGMPVVGEVHPSYIRGNPTVHEEMSVSFYKPNPAKAKMTVAALASGQSLDELEIDENDRGEWIDVGITQRELANISTDDGSFTYVIKQGPATTVVTYKRDDRTGYDYRSLL